MELVELGSILHMEKGKKPKAQRKEEAEGYLPYVDIKAFEQGIVDNYATVEKSLLCEEGDLLIVCDGSRSGLTGKAIKGVVGSTLSKIYADGLTTEYLRYFIQSKYVLLNTKKKGTGTPHLNANILKSSKLVVPSEDKQVEVVRKIEELFSSLDNAVETLNKIKDQLEVYRQAVLKEAFSSVMHFEKIRNASEFVTSGSRGWAKYYADKGALFIRIGNLTRTSIDINLEDKQYVNLPEKAEGKRTRLQPGDVLVSITADLGSIGFVTNKIQEAYVNQHIAMIRFKNPEQGEMYAWFLRSELGQKDLLKNKRGAGKLGLGLDDIRDSRVPNISDAEAKRIVDSIEERFSVCDSIQLTVDEALQQAEAMRQSILKEAFEGRL